MNLEERIAVLPDTERDRLIRLRQEITRSRANVKVNFKFIGMANGLLDQALSRDGRIAFYRWIFGMPDLTSSKQLTVGQMFGLVLWAGPQKHGDNSNWTFSRQCINDLPILIKLFSGGIGQAELPMPESDKPKRTKEQAIYDLGFYE